MTAYPIRLRIGSTHAGSPDTGYADSTFADAVAALIGGHPDGSYHQGQIVHVVATYPEAVHEPAPPHLRGGKGIDRLAGEPVFGHDVTVYPVDAAYGQPKPAMVSAGSIGTMTTDVAMLHVMLLSLATRLAEAANTAPACPGCVTASDGS